MGQIIDFYLKENFLFSASDILQKKIIKKVEKEGRETCDFLFISRNAKNSSVSSSNQATNTQVITIQNGGTPGNDKEDQTQISQVSKIQNGVKKYDNDEISMNEQGKNINNSIFFILE